jgi:hypothetical protein
MCSGLKRSGEQIIDFIITELSKSFEIKWYFFFTDVATLHLIWPTLKVYL